MGPEKPEHEGDDTAQTENLDSPDQDADDELDEDGFQVASGFVEAEHYNADNNPGTEWTLRYDAEAKEAHVELDIGIDVLEMTFENVETFADARARAEEAATAQQEQADESSRDEDEDEEDDDEDEVDDDDEGKEDEEGDGEDE